MGKRVRIPKPVSVPMIINRGMNNDELELRERMLVEAFSMGYATTEHYDNLADMRDCLVMAAARKHDFNALKFCELAYVALKNISARYAETGRMGTTGDELNALREFVTAYRDFWMRQPVSNYEDACDMLDRARKLAATEVEVAA